MSRYLLILTLLVGACEPAYAGHPYRICSTPHFAAPYVAPYVAPVAAALPHPSHPDFETATVNALYQKGVQERQQKKFALALQALGGDSYEHLGPVAVQGNGVYVETYRGYGGSALKAFSQQSNPHVFANQLARINEGAQALHGKVIEGGLQMAEQELALEKMRLAFSGAGDIAERVLRSSEPDTVQKITRESSVSAQSSTKTEIGSAKAAAGELVIQSRCVKCHSASKPGGGVDLSSLATFGRDAKDAVLAAIKDKKMPVKKVGDEYQHDPLTPAEEAAALDYLSR